MLLRLFTWWLARSRFLSALTLLAKITTRLITARTARGRWLLLALRLNTAECAAQFFKLAFVGNLLAFGNLDQLENFVHLVVQFFQRGGDEQGMFDRLADGRGRSGAEIGWLDPLTLADRNARRRLRRAFVATIFAAVITPRVAAFVTAGFAWRFRRGSCFRDRFSLVSFGVRCDFVRTETFGHVGMRLAKTAGGFGFMLAVRSFFRRSRG